VIHGVIKANHVRGRIVPVHAAPFPSSKPGTTNVIETCSILPLQ